MWICMGSVHLYVTYYACIISIRNLMWGDSSTAGITLKYIIKQRILSRTVTSQKNIFYLFWLSCHNFYLRQPEDSYNSQNSNFHLNWTLQNKVIRRCLKTVSKLLGGKHQSKWLKTTELWEAVTFARIVAQNYR